MRLESPQVQLGVLFAYGVLLVALVEFLTPCAETLLDRARLRVFVGTWREQLVVSVSGLLGILAANFFGPRVMLLLGSATGTLHSLAIVVAAHGHLGGYRFLLAAQVMDRIGHTMTRVCLVTMALTYPCERKKARVLALFQFVLVMFTTLGEVLRQNHNARRTGNRDAAEGAAWARLAVTGLAALCAVGVTPIGAVVRDTGVFVLARESHCLKREFCKTAKVFANRYMLLLVPYMFAFPFALGIMGISFPNRQSIILYNIGSLLALVLAFVLDIGSRWRRRRGQLGFALVTCVTAVCMVIMSVLTTRNVDEQQLPGLVMRPGSPVNVYRLQHYRQLFYVTVFFNGMSISCVFLFAGWVIGSLTNDVQYTARFTGALLAFPALGTLASILCVGPDDDRVEVPPNSPLYVGIALLAASSCSMYYVVHSISDTNDWSLAAMKGWPRSSPATMPRSENCVVAFRHDDAASEHNSIAKLPLPAN
ncbi:hypothetical protein GGF46_001483 [Coemansia sp. RSA 552]|nr:hypothetical protein GGF46_001483 [Coemansia sp. RSA 552]